MECPRCRAQIEQIELRGGPYRGAIPTEGLARCRACSVTFVDAGKLGARIPKQAGFISIERHRKAISLGCPRCLTSLEQVYVEYEELAVQYEACARCELLVLDDGEIGSLRAIASAARGVPSAAVPGWTGVEPLAPSRGVVLDELGALIQLLTRG